MLDVIAALVGFLGASFIGFAVIGGTTRPRTLAIIGTALTVVAVILLFLVVFNVSTG